MIPLRRLRFLGGRGRPAEACVWHPAEPPAFQCRQCLDPMCRRCRAPGERDLCVRCQDYHRRADVEDAFGRPRARPRRRRALRYAIAALVVANLALGGAWLARPPAVEPPAAVDALLADVAAIARFVEGRRDADRKVPPTLFMHLAELPRELILRLAHSEIVYTPSADRTTFELVARLGAPARAAAR